MRRAVAGAVLTLAGAVVLLLKFPWQLHTWFSGKPDAFAMQLALWLALPILGISLAVGLLLKREWARLLLCLLAILCVWVFGRQVWAIAYWRLAGPQEMVQAEPWLFHNVLAWMMLGLVTSASILFLAATGRVREALPGSGAR
jgi:hypothetical protein